LKRISEIERRARNKEAAPRSREVDWQLQIARAAR
jgi:hypothetical protein